jgi:hypothetical protein
MNIQIQRSTTEQSKNNLWEETCVGPILRNKILILHNSLNTILRQTFILEIIGSMAPDN